MYIFKYLVSSGWYTCMCVPKVWFKSRQKGQKGQKRFVTKIITGLCF